jgi:hypothetical protein
MAAGLAARKALLVIVARMVPNVDAEGMAKSVTAPPAN